MLIIFAFKDSFLYIAVLALYPVSKYPRLLLLVVMVLIPLVFNTIQFWIIDEFLRYKKSKEEETPTVSSQNSEANGVPGPNP